MVKKAIELIVTVKNFAAMAFTGSIMLYVVIGSLLGGRSLPFGVIWQFLCIALICGVLQFILFSDIAVKKMRYGLRLLCCAVPLYLALAAFAFAFRWFAPNMGNWLLFTAVFLAFFGILTAAFYLYFRITGKRYNEMLNAYKSRRDG